MTQRKFSNRRNFVESFINNPRSELVYASGRMYTRESPDGDSIQLVAYGNEIIAEAADSTFTFFVGHHGQVSQTVTRYIKKVGSVLSNGGFSELDVDVRYEAPTNGYIARHINSAAAQYIDNYIGGFGRNESPVEQDARADVETALSEILEIEFSDTSEE